MRWSTASRATTAMPSRAVVGSDYRKYIPAETMDPEDITNFLEAWARAHSIVRAGADKAFLGVGRIGWTLPIPIIKSAAGWRFDTNGAPDEMRIRRIGRNELAAIQVALAYTDAQDEYHARDWNGDGVLEYATRGLSSPGKRDGLYWASLPGEPESPLGAEFADARAGQPYHGYLYKILTAQGKDAPGGARSYVKNGHMTEGYALVAWPAQYGDTGVMTFIVSKDGIVYQKNLGADADAAGRAISDYNPDASWSKTRRRNDVDEGPIGIRDSARRNGSRFLAGRQRAAAALVTLAAPRTADGLGAGRRAVFFALLTWLPIVVWAAATGQLWNDATGERLLQHYGVHVRCLVAIPLLILAEAAMHGTARRMASQFVSSGIVGPDQRAGFDLVIGDVRRLRDGSLLWVLVLGAAIAWSFADQPAQHDDAMAWAVGADGTLGFGGWWSAYVVRPIFLALVMGWLWRMLLVTTGSGASAGSTSSSYRRTPTARVDSRSSRSSPGHSRWWRSRCRRCSRPAGRMRSSITPRHWIRSSSRPPRSSACGRCSCCCRSSRSRRRCCSARARAIPAYSALVGEQGRLVHRRWILREPVDDNPILDASEIGPVADAATMYDAVKRMRVVPIGKAAIVKMLVPIALPMIVVAALQIPLKQLLVTVVKALV